MTSPGPIEPDDEPVLKPFNPERELNLLFLFSSLRVRSFCLLIEHFLQPLPVFKDLFLVVRPAGTWNRIAASRHGVGFTFLFYLLPMLLLLGVVEGHGLMLLGRQQVAEGMNNRFTFARVFVYEAGSGLLLLLLIYFTASMIKAFANACHSRNHLGQGLVVLFQAVGPMLLIQLFNGFPNIYLWLTWFVGVVLAIGSLYHGLPRIMQPDPPSAMGLYCASAVVMGLMMFAGRFLTYWYLIGEFRGIEKCLSAVADKLPF